MLRLALRRDRISLPVWAAVLAAVVVSSVAATADLYPDPLVREQAARDATAAAGGRFMFGPIHDPASLGALATWKLVGMGGAFVALLAMGTVRRHTRSDEEVGRLELVSAGVLGKRAALTAAVTVASAGVLLASTLAAVGNIAVGLPVAGSVAFGAAWAGVGLFFVAATAVVAQLTESARACGGAVAALLGLSYLVRGVADAVGGTAGSLTWFSPLGWAVEIRPYAGDRWWVLVLPAMSITALLAVAYRLQDRRDLGAGMLPTRPGPARASSVLSSPLGLAWRLQRGMLAGWAAALAVVGVVLGSMVNNIGGMVSPETRELLERIGGVGALRDVFLSAEFALLSVAVSGYAVAALLRLGSEEGLGHAESVLATATSRREWFASHALIALLGSTALMATVGLSVGLSLGVQLGDVPGTLADLVPAALAQAPAVWVMAGVAAILYGISQRLGPAAWVVLAAFLVLGQFGELFALPQAVMSLSPFDHTPQAPVEALSAAPLAALTAVAVALAAAGAMAFRRRDVG